MLGAALTANLTNEKAAGLSEKLAASSQNGKRLIINADDCGLSRGITDAILLTHREGILTSTSLMVNQPATEYAVDQLHNTPSLDVGIHLNLCQGKPVLPPGSIPSLVGQDGNFLPPSEIGRRLVRWQVSTKEIEAEFCAQIDLMLSHGITPSHADSHHRFHIYPAAAGAFCRAARSKGIRRARASRKECWPANGVIGNAHAGSLFRRLAVTTYNDFLQKVIFRNLALPDAGVALHPRFRHKLELLPEAWRFAIENMPAGVYEIWCHPGFPEPAFSETDALRDQRRVEIGILTNPALRDAIRTSQVQLVNFSAVQVAN